MSDTDKGPTTSKTRKILSPVMKKSTDPIASERNARRCSATNQTTAEKPKDIS
jgi:hypothetical protein